jgi:hypothetical protein
MNGRFRRKFTDLPRDGHKPCVTRQVKELSLVVTPSHLDTAAVGDWGLLSRAWKRLNVDQE